MHECQNYLGGGGGLGGSEKNRGTVITSLQLVFRRRDRNLTNFANSAGDEKHARHIKHLFRVFTNISFRETVILYSFWAIPENKIGKHAQVKHFPNQSGKHARLTADFNGKPPDKKPGISERSFFALA